MNKTQRKLTIQESLNYDLIESQSKSYKKYKKMTESLLTTIINKIPRADLINILIKKKIIKKDWMKDGNKYKLR